MTNISSKLIDMSLDLPVVIEFYDEKTKIDEIINYLNSRIKHGHIVYWPARVNEQLG